MFVLDTDVLTLYQFGEMIDIRPEKGSHYIHSMSEPFSEEDIEDEVKHRWLDHFGLNFHQIHASGHANKDELRYFIDKIGAKMSFPIHTEHPEMFEGKGVVGVEKGKKYKV